MIKSTLTFFVLLFFFKSYSQENIVKIEKTNYTSYFDTCINQPIVVTYKLYMGGGDCSRSRYRFKNDLNIKTATWLDYKKSGYDRGHLANAEDFAYNCELLELTFRYYNCLPQSKFLNRGVWKKKEKVVREMSKIDTVLIICFGREFFRENKLNVPKHCGKIIFEKSGKVHFWYFDQNGNILPPDEKILKEYIVYVN